MSNPVAIGFGEILLADLYAPGLTAPSCLNHIMIMLASLAIVAIKALVS